MAKIIKRNDSVFKIEYIKPHYYLYRQVGHWWWKEWHRIYFTDNKVKFIQQINRYFV